MILVTFLLNETRRLFVKHILFVKRITYVCFGHAVTSEMGSPILIYLWTTSPSPFNTFQYGPVRGSDYKEGTNAKAATKDADAAEDAAVEAGEDATDE